MQFGQIEAYGKLSQVLTKPEIVEIFSIYFYSADICPPVCYQKANSFPFTRRRFGT
jgi:hypothetical protein